MARPVEGHRPLCEPGHPSFRTTATHVMSSDWGAPSANSVTRLMTCSTTAARRLIAHLENCLLETLHAELSRLRVFGFGHAIGVEQQHVAGRQRDRPRLRS